MKVASALHDTCLALGLDPREVARRESVEVIVSLPAEGDRFELDGSERLPGVNGFAARLDPDELQRLREKLPRGSVVQLDRPLDFRPMVIDADPVATDPKLEEVFQPALPGIAEVHRRGFTGQGVTVAVIDSGLHPHPDYRDRIVDWVDFTADKRPTPTDTIGHGTNVGGILAGNGARSGGKLKGAAPEANLVGVRIGTVKEAIMGLQWVIENKDRLGIRVINMSLGEQARLPFKQDLWAQLTQKAIDAGLVVVVAAGNEGPTPGSISTPGILPDAITVGAYDNRGTPTEEDDAVAGDSSRGPTADGHAKPDIVAPGVRIFGALAPNSRKDNPERPRIGRDYSAESGTSQATPQIAGLAACLLQANPSLDHHAVKAILRDSAVASVPGGPLDQGAGLVHADRALARALS